MLLWGGFMPCGFLFVYLDGWYCWIFWSLFLIWSYTSFHQVPVIPLWMDSPSVREVSTVFYLQHDSRFCATSETSLSLQISHCRIWLGRNNILVSLSLWQFRFSEMMAWLNPFYRDSTVLKNNYTDILSQDCHQPVFTAWILNLKMP